MLCQRLHEEKIQLQLLQVMGSAVELLEVMLEETSPASAAIKKGLQEAVDVECLLHSMVYFHKMSCNELVRKEEMDDDATRGKFRSYHALVALSDSDSKIGSKTIGHYMTLNSSLSLSLSLSLSFSFFCLIVIVSLIFTHD